MVLPCFDDALRRGAGEEPSAAYASTRFTTLLEEERHILRRAKPNRLEGLAATRDPIEVNFWLNSGDEALAFKALRRAPRYEPDADERAALRYLGLRLTRAAVKSLPKSCLTIARNWQTASPEGRIELARRLMNVLRYTSKAKSMVEQIASQKAENVLPLEYMKTKTWNCLGSLQRLRAFCRVAGIRSFASIPIQSAEHVHYREAIPRARRLRSIVQSAPGAANRLAADDISLWLKYAENSFCAPSWLHFGIVLDLGGDCWALVDPSANQFGVFTGKDESVARKIRALERYAPMFPGLKIVHHSPEAVAKLDGVMDGFDEAVGAAGYYARLCGKPGLDTMALASGIPDRLIELQERYDGKPLGEPFSALGASGPDTPFTPGALKAFKQCSIASRLALSAASRGEREPEAAEYSAWFARLGTQMCTNEFVEIRERDLVHPVFELGDAEYTIAVSTLGHLAWCANRSDEARRVLVNHCGSQFRLLYYAGLALEPGPAEPPLRVTRACDRLRGYRTKLTNSVEFLAQLERLERAS